MLLLLLLLGAFIVVTLGREGDVSDDTVEGIEDEQDVETTSDAVDCDDVTTLTGGDDETLTLPLVAVCVILAIADRGAAAVVMIIPPPSGNIPAIDTID